MAINVMRHVLPTIGFRSTEIFNSDETVQQNALKEQVMTFLNGRKTIDKDNATLIEWGFRLVTYHKMNLETATQAR
jgi:hypothetical protein